MPDNIRPDEAHAEAEELLPWYATGQLDAADRAIVENHLSSCVRCRRQLAAERQLIDEFQSLTPEVDTSWTRLRTQIEARPTPRSRFANAAAEFWTLISRPAVVTFATAQLAFVILAGSILLYLSRPTYHALGGAEVSSAANLIVIFRPEATEEDIRDALRASGAQLVGGPTSADAYLVHVPAKQRETALAKLQSDDDVQMAQPIDEAAR